MNKKKLFVRMIVMVLCLAIMIQTVPPGLQLFANEVADTKDSLEKKEAYILYEDETKRGQNYKQFLMSDKSYMISMYDDDVHYYQNEKWEEIDNSFSDKGTAGIDIFDGYENQKNSFKVKFSKNINSGKLYKLKKDDISLDWSFISGKQSTSTALIKNGESKDIESKLTKNNNEKFLNLSKHKSEVRYDDILPGVDLQYILSGSNIKENIIVKNKLDSYDFAFELSLNKAGLKVEDDGSIIIYKLKKGKNESSTLTEETTTIKETEISDASTETASEEDSQDILEVKESIEPNNEALETDQKPEVAKETDGSQDLREESELDLDIVNNIDIDIKVDDEIDPDDIVFIIPAPYMYDAEYKYSYDVKYEVEEVKKGKTYIIKVVADSEWINSEERKFPVVIDPGIETKQDRTKITTTMISEKEPNAKFYSQYAMRHVGSSKEYHNCRTLIRIELPTNVLDKSDIVVQSNLHLWQYSTSYIDGKPLPTMAIHQITSSWVPKDVTWGTRPSYNNNALDWAYMDKASAYYYNVDVTQAVKKWYNNSDPNSNNYGFILKAKDEPVKDDEGKFVPEGYIWLIGEKYGDSYTEGLPFLTIIYRNNKGLEDYWTYHQHSAAGGGTGYVNDYTGNLVFIHGHTSTSGNRMPMLLSHVFNGYLAGKKFSSSNANTNSYTYMDVGYGWKMSIQQTVVPISTSSDLYKKGYRYIYTDGDGTEHYFYQTGAECSYKIMDEDGLGLVITKNTDYTITDKNKNKLIFNSSGYLKSVVDSNGNTLSVTYDSSGTRVTSVKDGAGRIATFVYSGNNLIKIKDPSSTTERYVEFYYSSTYNGTLGNYGNYLRRISYSDGMSFDYNYYSYGALRSVVNNKTGETIEYDYTYNHARRVSKITEKNGSNIGQTLKITYSGDNTTTYQTSGKDDIIDTSDDILTTYIFDNLGRTLVVHSENCNKSESYGSAMYSYTKYEAAPGQSNYGIYKINKIENSGASGKNITNLLKNHSAENDDTWYSYIWGSDGYSYNTQFDTSQKYIGNRSFKVNPIQANSSRTTFRQNINLPPGTYTLSAYVKTNNVTGNGAFINAYVWSPSGNSSNDSRYIKGTTDTAINNGWQRLSVTFTVPSDSTSTGIFLGVRNGTGTAWFDAVQLEKESAANDYNLLENSSFENSTTGWDTSNVGSGGRTSSYRKDGSYSYYISGEPTAARNISQTVKVNTSNKQTFILSGWAKANSVAIKDSRKFALAAQVNYTSGSPDYFEFEFNPDTSAWQFVSGVIVPKSQDEKTISTITVYLKYDCNMNTAYFDNIYLIRDDANSYKYDENGNVVSVKASADQKSNFEYDSNNNMTKMTNPSGHSYTYQYNSVNNNLEKATSESGIDYYFSYDSYGNPISSRIEKSSYYSKLYSSMTYKNGNYIDAVTDSRGKVTDYDYNSTSGLLNYVTDPKGNRTSYKYISTNDFLEYVYLDANKNGVLDSNEIYNQYIYSNRRLDKIKHNGFAYDFDYDVFGNVSTIKIGTQPLITHEYGSYNGKLKKSTYGNGFYTENVYDSLERIIGKKNNGVLDFEWKYNSLGHVVQHIDRVNNVTYNFEYDSIGRLIRQYASNLLNFEINYDATNRIVKQTYKYGSESAKTYKYSYLKDNMIDVVTLPTGASIRPGYDHLGRLSYKYLCTTPQCTSYLYESYSYEAGSGGTGATTTLINKIYYNGGKNISYTYDDNGNINTISENGVEKARYYYDALNQLIREDNKYINKTITYEYDKGGNILNKKEYAYTTGSLGAVQKAITYGYGDSNWKDKLTSYDGQTITYDAIGNPLSYRGYTLTWEKGRQLKSLSGDGITASYKYNADGIRTQKVVNGVTTNYYLDGSTIVREERGSTKIWYLYDENGQVIGMEYNGTPYYFQKNLQGDIIRIYNSNAEVVTEYTYDSWGKVLSVTGTLASTIGEANPFRYRGYYYDSETGFYSLQSRYYDPEIGRFINADNQLSTGSDFTGMNLFAYCGNNPVMRVDPTGHAWWHWAIAATVVVACAVAVVATAGGAAPALMAVSAVASGMAAPIGGAAATVSAAAFIGSATYLGVSAMSAAENSSSLSDFGAQGNWGTVAGTVGSAVVAGGSAYLSTRGSTSSTSSGKGTQNPKVKAAVQKGQAMHKQMDYGPGVLKEQKIAPGCRVDGIDFNNKIIYELKPNNPQAISRGLAQLERYTTAASQQYGGEWTGVLKLYD